MLTVCLGVYGKPAEEGLHVEARRTPLHGGGTGYTRGVADLSCEGEALDGDLGILHLRPGGGHAITLKNKQLCVYS